MKKQKSAVAVTTRKAAPIYKDAKQPSARRVKDLLSRMTLEEKAAQMLCVWQKKAETLVDTRATSISPRRRSHLEMAAGWARWAARAMPAAAKTLAAWPS